MSGYGDGFPQHGGRSRLENEAANAVVEEMENRVRRRSEALLDKLESDGVARLSGPMAWNHVRESVLTVSAWLYSMVRAKQDHDLPPAMRHAEATTARVARFLVFMGGTLESAWERKVAESQAARDALLRERAKEASHAGTFVPVLSELPVRPEAWPYAGMWEAAEADPKIPTDEFTDPSRGGSSV